MGLCRRGHGQFEGRQCGVCKAAWEKDRRPKRGASINAKRAEERAQAYRFGRIAPGRALNMTRLMLRRLARDGACRTCGCPTTWGTCTLCKSEASNRHGSRRAGRRGFSVGAAYRTTTLVVTVCQR